MTNCPYCKQELDELVVSIRATQTISKYSGWSPVEDIEEILEYSCPHCGTSLDYNPADELADKLIDEYEKGE